MLVVAGWVFWETSSLSPFGFRCGLMCSLFRTAWSPQFQSVFCVQTRGSWVFPRKICEMSEYVFREPGFGQSVFVLLVTCCELRRNYCRSQSCSQTGSAAFYHSSSLPAFLKENELFGSPPPMEKVLWRIGLQENFSWGSFCWWDGFWGEVGR